MAKCTRAIILLVLLTAFNFSFAYEEENIYDKITRFSVHFGVPPREMIALIRCETGNRFDTFLQSEFIRPNGRRENSWGLAQINLDAWKNITKAQATDPHFALIFMAQNLKAGKYNLWYTCSKKMGLL